SCAGSVQCFGHFGFDQPEDVAGQSVEQRCDVAVALQFKAACCDQFRGGLVVLEDFHAVMRCVCALWLLGSFSGFELSFPLDVLKRAHFASATMIVGGRKIPPPSHSLRVGMTFLKN